MKTILAFPRFHKTGARCWLEVERCGHSDSGRKVTLKVYRGFVAEESLRGDCLGSGFALLA